MSKKSDIKIFYSKLLYKMGQYFLDIKYNNNFRVQILGHMSGWCGPQSEETSAHTSLDTQVSSLIVFGGGGQVAPCKAKLCKKNLFSRQICLFYTSQL